MGTEPTSGDTPREGAERAEFEDLPRSLRERLPSRDPEALTIFYETYFDRLYGYVRRMVGEEHLAEDLTQEVFLHLHRNLDGYDPSRALRPWVFTIATNKVRDYWRSRAHQSSLREIDIDEDEQGGRAASEERGPDRELQAADLSELIAEAVEKLPESMRSTLILRYYEGLSFQAISEIVERNEAAVRKRYSRALEELRKLLAGRGLAPMGGEA